MKTERRHLQAKSVARRTIREYFHRTTEGRAAAILRNGFKDSDGRYRTIQPHQGVWLSDAPVAAQESAQGSSLLVVTIAPRNITKYERGQQGNGYSEYCVPARIVNRHATSIEDATLMEEIPALMAQQYRLHFGFSKTKKYLQLLKLADLARHHEVRESGKDVWHILTFDDSQIDLMAQAHSLAGSRPSCEVRLRGVPVWLLRSGAYPIETDQKPNPNARSTIWSRARAACIQLMKELNLTAPQFKTYLEDTYFKEIRSDNKQINNVLRAHGYLPTGKVEEEGKEHPRRKPEEQIALNRDIRNLISAGQYAKAVKKYYKYLGNEPFGKLNNELLYLKRLALIPISGRDLLAFRPKGSWPTLIKDNVWEYCSCIDSVLEMFQKAGRASPLEVLIESVLPLDQLLERKQRWHNKGVSLLNGKIKINKTGSSRVTVGPFWAIIPDLTLSMGLR